MTTSYKTLQNTLKSLRTEGYDVQVPLNSKKDVLITELKRLYAVIETEELELLVKREEVRFDLSVAKEQSGNNDLDNMSTDELFAEADSLLDSIDSKCAQLGQDIAIAKTTANALSVDCDRAVLEECYEQSAQPLSAVAQAAIATAQVHHVIKTADYAHMALQGALMAMTAVLWFLKASESTIEAGRTVSRHPATGVVKGVARDWLMPGKYSHQIKLLEVLFCLS